MIQKPKAPQLEYEFVCVENLVPEDHLLRKIDKYIDFDFIYDKVADLYCADNGRPALDPVVMFKMLFIGYLYGIRSERQLVREISVNVAYRWFLNFTLETKIPHASTFSQNRRRRFKESSVYQEIFDEIVFQAMKHKMVDGKQIYTDSTHLKASANKNKFKRKEVAKSTKSYLKDLEKDVSEDRKNNNKKPLKPKAPKQEKKSVKKSTTDPDSGYMVRDGKPKGFFYLDHRSVDNKFTIITDTHVTPGNVHDSIPYLDRIDRQKERFGFDIDAVGIDAGYITAPICKGLEDRGIYGVMPYKRVQHPKGYFSKASFLYDACYDAYICPANKHLKYRNTTREGYREFVSNPEICKKCELLSQCTKSKNNTKVVTRHIWEDSRERIDDNRFTTRGKAIYKRRKETVERSFADAKQLHGHRYAKMRGLTRVKEQCLLCAAVMNMKKIALHLSRKEGKKKHKGDTDLFLCLKNAIYSLISLQHKNFITNYI